MNHFDTVAYRKPERNVETEQIAVSNPGSAGYIFHVHGAYDYSSPFGFLWVLYGSIQNCVIKQFD